MGRSIPFGAHIETTQVKAGASDQQMARAESVAWTIWCMVEGITSEMIGGPWDISWHKSIGGDTFWSPAHVMIRMAGVLVGIACAYMILTTTFAGDWMRRMQR